jgi:VIT1/CCC1 family predicted Fe2+/Mn2+ transporter
MSNLFNLNSQDLLKGFIVAFLSAALTGIVATLDAGALPTIEDIKSAGVVGITAGLSYLLKNLLTNSQGEILKKD